MSWSGLANNQCVSGNNLNNAVTTGQFTAKTSIPFTNKELTSNEATSYVYINATGKAANQLVVKSNLVATSSNPTNPIYNYRFYGIGLNSNNEYYPVYTINGGVTWGRYTTTSIPTNIPWSCISGSSDGRIIAVGANASPNQSQQFYLSTNYGATFNFIQLPITSGFFSSYQIQDIDMSSDGRVIAVLISTSGSTDSYVTASVSTDYGASFTTSTTFRQAYSVGRISVSGNGNYIQYVAADFINSFSWRVYSSNSGTTFTISGTSSLQVFKDISLSNTGQYQLIVNEGTNGTTGNLFVSSNYGSTFPSKSTYGLGQRCSMDSSGANMTVIRAREALGSSLAYSVNFGNNWTAKSIPTNNDFSVGIALGDYLTAPLTSTFASNNTQSYGLYSGNNTFSTVYTQQYSYGTYINAISKKAFKI